MVFEGHSLEPSVKECVFELDHGAPGVLCCKLNTKISGDDGKVLLFSVQEVLISILAEQIDKGYKYKVQYIK